MRAISFLFLTAVLSIVFPESSRATLVPINSAYGPTSLTYDTATNLEWLDLSFTQGLSFNAVFSQLQPGGQFDGFRYATKSELDGLMADAAIPYRDARQLYFDDAQSARDLIDLLGPTAGGNGEVQSVGILGEPAYSWQSPEARAVGFIYWRSTPALFTSSPDYPFAQASPSGHAASVWSWDSSASRGSFLIRDGIVATVPAPAAAWLMGTGLLVLFGVSKRKMFR